MGRRVFFFSRKKLQFPAPAVDVFREFSFRFFFISPSCCVPLGSDATSVRIAIKMCVCVAAEHTARGQHMDGGTLKDPSSCASGGIRFGQDDTDQQQQQPGNGWRFRFLRLVSLRL